MMRMPAVWELGSHRREAVGTEDRQELQLTFGVELADLFEQQRAAASGADRSPCRAGSEGNGFSGMPEQLGSAQRGRNSSTMEGDERTAGTRAVGVNGAGDELLA